MAAVSQDIDIIDIRAHPASSTDGNTSESDVRHQILHGLSAPSGEKSLPTLLLYNEEGLQLYDQITTQAPEYYLFPAEEEILKRHSDEIARCMHASFGPCLKPESLVELGAGSLRKTSHILKSVAGLFPYTPENPPVTYYALDLEKRELDRTLTALSSSKIGSEIQGKIATKGLCATYEDGLKFVQNGGLQESIRSTDDLFAHYQLDKPARDASPSSGTSELTRSASTEMTPPSTPGQEEAPHHILFLGSSLGNFPRGEDASFLRSLPLRPGSGNTLLLGLDHDNGRQKVELAYNDPHGYTRSFIMNGLKNAGRILGLEAFFDETKWEYLGGFNEKERRHEAYYKSKESQQVVDLVTGTIVSIIRDELVRIEISQKYSEEDTYALFAGANLRPIQRWMDSASQYSLWLLERPTFTFPLLTKPNKTSTPFGVPTIQEWYDMWAAWDYVNRRMIPPSMLYEKPIDLRHICLFYQGHIPTFLDIHLSRLLKEPHTQPEEFKYIFERGIDPNVDDPSQCHPHSEVPTEESDWPKPQTILEFQSRVRERLLNLYDNIESGTLVLTRKVARVLYMTLEHEAFHAETLLYMLLQRAGTGTIAPSGFSSPKWSILASSWDQAPKPTKPTVSLGPATIELGHDDDEADDDSTDVDGHEFGWDNEHPKRKVQVGEFKIEWRPITNGEFYAFWKSEGKDKVKFPSSWIDLDNEVQVRTLYGPVHMDVAQHWPIITSYDNLSTYASVKGGRIPTEPELRLFYDKFDCGFEGGANVGFRNWHPVPATTGGKNQGGRGHNGGVWEWTSTVFDAHDGFVPSRLYPGYSTDFFDNQHQVVIGGSYATIPRLAGRRTLRNYYQHNYPYAWTGARIVYDNKN